MAFKLALFAAVFVAQGFAFQLRGNGNGNGSGNDVCTYPSFEFPYQIDQAMQEMDDVRDIVSMATMDAYARGNNLKVIIACFRKERGNYIRLGIRVAQMVTDASLELSLKLADKADRYTRLIEPPMVKIAFTIAGLPDVVYTHIKNKEYLKAAEAVIQARRIVDENAREIAGHIKDLAGELPEFAERAMELARGIHKEAKESCDAINQAFKTCVEEGGPAKPSFKEEGEQQEQQIESDEE